MAAAQENEPPAVVTEQSVQAEVIRQLGKGNYAEACGILDENFSKDTQDPTILFLRARCKMGLQSYGDAVEDYERLVTISPDSLRAKQELVEARVLQGKSSPTKKSKSWFARGEAGIIYDSNINSGPQSDQVTIVGIPVTLGVVPVESSGYSFQGLAGYVYAFSAKNVWLIKTAVEDTDYFTGGQNGFQSFNLSGGPTFQLAEKVRLSIQPGYTWQSFGGATYNTYFDVISRLSIKTTEDTTHSLRLSFIKNDYKTVSGRDGYVFSANPTVEHKVTENMTVSGTLITRFENTPDSAYSSEAYGMRFNLEQALGKDFKANFGYQKTSRQYDAPEVIYSPSPRHDNQYSNNIGVSWNIEKYTSPETFINIKYQYVSNKSSLPVYTFNRETTTLSLSKLW